MSSSRLLIAGFPIAAALGSGCTASTPSPAGAPAPAAGQGASAASAPATAAPRSSDFLPLRYDAAAGKVYLTVPRLGERMLYFNTLASGFGSPAVGLDRGEVGIDAVVRFERRGARVYLIRENTTHRAVTGDSALQASVRESFPQSVLASMAVQREGPEGVTVDATDFLLSDVYDVVGRLRAARVGNVRLDAGRSFIDHERSRSFDRNTEVRAVLSYVSDDPGFELRRHAPDGRTVTLQQHHSFLRLPEVPAKIRPFDPRAGLFASSYFDFSRGFDEDYRQRGVVRWRLEPRDTAAYLRGEKVDPVRPIIYYVDPAIPEPYRSAFLQGGRWWSDIFAAAGWRNAFRVEPLPAGVDPLDARYPVILWVHRTQRGPSVGPALRDPRTGEILTTIVRMDSYRSLVDHDIYMGLMPAAGDRGLQLSAEEFSMARRRQHMAHEIGHTLGIAHNYIAAAQGRSSVMDYPYPLIAVDRQGRLDISQAYRPSGGAHDTLAIRYAYTWYPDSASEAAGLRAIVREAEARGLRFIGDAHVGASGSYPSASQWIEGSDMLEALDRTMAVRRVLIEAFDERAAQPGEPLAVLNRRFAHVYLHHRYALNGAIKYVGGMEFGYALRGEPTEATRVLPAAEQRRALSMVLSALAPSELRVPERVIAIIPPVPPGWDSDLSLIPTPAGTAFDPISTAHSLAQEIIDGLLHPQRAARLISFNARNPANPSLGEVVEAVIERTWGSSGSSAPVDAAIRRATQRAAVDALLDLAGNPDATPAVRSVAGGQLAQLAARIGREPGSSAEDRAHRAAARRDVQLFMDGRDDRERRTRPSPIPLPWP
jgi:hypothetical protein